MTNISPGDKVAEVTDSGNTHCGWVVFCPGCGCAHIFDTRWEFNGNRQAPSFTPSLLVHAVPGHSPRCHSYLTDGVWRYLGDCDHAMAGQHVPAPEFHW